jgi:anaerobic magnesium-protoporphyrin IX monomethyl ester cyclase
MVDSGCTKVAFGVESGSERIVQLNRKKIDFERVRAAVRWAREAGIRHVEGNFIIASHPDETWEDVQATMRLMQSLPFTFVSISVLVPYPGTENYELMDDGGLIHDKDWSRFVMFGQRPSWRTTHFSSDELLRLQRLANRSFYLRPSQLLRLLGTVRSAKELGYYVNSAVSFFRWLLGKPDLASSDDALSRVEVRRLPVDRAAEDRIHHRGSALHIEPELIRGPVRGAAY